MTIGEIQLDLVINNTIGKQVQDAADKAKKPAEAAFSAVGDVISSAVSKPMEAAQASIKKSLDGIDKRVDETKKKFKGIDNMSDAELHDLNPEFRKSPKDIGETTMAWKKSPELQSNPKKQAPKIEVEEIFSVASDAVGLLNQKLDITYTKLYEQEAKLKQLATLWNEAVYSDGAGSEAAVKYNAQIESTKEKLVSLQQTALPQRAEIHIHAGEARQGPGQQRGGRQNGCCD